MYERILEPVSPESVSCLTLSKSLAPVSLPRGSCLLEAMEPVGDGGWLAEGDH